MFYPVTAHALQSEGASWLTLTDRDGHRFTLHAPKPVCEAMAAAFNKAMAMDAPEEPLPSQKIGDAAFVPLVGVIGPDRKASSQPSDPAIYPEDDGA